MVAYMVMRWVYGGYIVGAALMLYRAVSLMIFHPEFRDKKKFLKQILFICFWPFSLFTKNGRHWLKRSLPFLEFLNKKEEIE